MIITGITMTNWETKQSNSMQIKTFCNYLFTKITAVKNEVTLSYHRVFGLYFLAVIFAAIIVNVIHTP